MSSIDTYFQVWGGVTVVGTKQIEAVPVCRGEYNNVRGWIMPENEEYSDEGYMVRYPDGYVSWSPKEVFEETYQHDGALDFSSALFLIKAGLKLTRLGWNGVDMFIFQVDGSHFEVNRAPLLGIFPPGTHVDYHSHIDMKTADDTIVPWIASQSDLAANDWMIHG